jgi:hypothetical protein
MDREWSARLRPIALEDYTVESIQTVVRSQPKIPVRGLCQRCDRTRRSVFRTPCCMRELRNGPIASKRGRRQTCKREEKADLQHPTNVSKTDDRGPASSRATEIRPSSAREQKHHLGHRPWPTCSRARTGRPYDRPARHARSQDSFIPAGPIESRSRGGVRLPPGIPHTRIAPPKSFPKKSRSHACVSDFRKESGQFPGLVASTPALS